MRAGIVADIHFSLYSQDNIVKGLPRRLYYINKILNNIIKDLLKLKIYKLIIAGDTLHNKSIIHSLAQAMLLDTIKQHPEMQFIIIDGNHDMSSKSGDGVSALKSLDSEPNVIMVHSATQIENVAFVPWNPKTMKNDIKKSKADYLVSHFGLNEAMLNSGISIVSDIGLKDLKHFKRCFIGHYHLPQKVGNVIIPGSIIQLDWGEKGEKKRFLVFDSDTGVVDSILIKGYQKHVELICNATNADEVLLKASELKESGNFVKILKTEPLGEIDFKGFNVVDKTIKDITNRGIDSTMSTEDKLKAYLKIKEIPVGDHEEYLQVAKYIIDLVL